MNVIEKNKQDRDTAEIDFQDKCGDFVSRNVLVCQSALVEMLLEKEVVSIEDITNLYIDNSDKIDELKAEISELEKSEIEGDENKAQVLEDKIEELEAELEISDGLLKDRDRLLNAIPQCVAHGPCVPHAIEWINQVKTLAKVISDG